MGNTGVFESATHLYDTAFLDWLGNCRVDYATLGGAERRDFPILRVIASPERSLAPVVDFLVASNFVAGADAEAMRTAADESRDMRVFPLPLLTISIGDPVPDLSRGSPAKYASKAYFDPRTGLWVPHRMPSFYRVPYTVNLWCMYRYTAAYFREWIMAQLGQPGAAQDELFLPVQHAEPWGSQLHALKLESVNDNSELEGTGPRYFRIDYAFNMRQAVMHLPGEGEAPLSGLDTAVYVQAAPEELEPPTPDAVYQSPMGPNLYRDPSQGGATAGDATAGWAVKAGGALVPRMTMRSPADTVALAGWPVRTDAEGMSLVSVSLSYRAAAAVSLAVQQVDRRGPGPAVDAEAWTLPITGRNWRQAHHFALLTQDGMQVLLRGTGTPTFVDFYLDGVPSIRMVRMLAQWTPASPVAVPGGVEYRWSGLYPAPCLVALAVAATGGADVQVVWRNSIAGATYTEARMVNDTRQKSTVFLGQPRGTDMALFIASGATLARVFAVPYDGPYDGNL